MNAKGAILVGCFQDVAWIRVVGSANQVNSEPVKKFISDRIDAGKPIFVVDLEQCTTMDSTFIGMLTALAKRIGELFRGKQGQVQIINANERNFRALTTLGVTRFIEIDEEGTAWPEERKLVSQNVTKTLPPSDQTKKERAELMLEAHEALVQANRENLSQFEDVIEFLKRDIEAESSSG